VLLTGRCNVQATHRHRPDSEDVMNMLMAKTRCRVCGGEIPQVAHRCAAQVREPEPADLLLDDLAAAVWVQAYDAAWLGRDWSALERRLAPDVALALSGFSATIIGRTEVLAHLRAVMRTMHVHEYNATDLNGHASGAAGVITYRWQLDCTVDRERRASSGRDILVLRSAGAEWQLVWRAQALA
jgi:hypothetical protein